jgi:MerR family copper efflux transcriptional regulator
MQIGDVAEQTGLSFRTIRYYEEIGLLEPPRRTTGGFRLYRAVDVERLLLIKAVRPLRLDLDETRAMLEARDRMLSADGASGDASIVATYLAFAERRLSQARVDIEAAEKAIRMLRRDLSRARGR